MPTFTGTAFPEPGLPTGTGFDLGSLAGGILDAVTIREQRKLLQAAAPLSMAPMARQAGRILSGPFVGSVTQMAGRAVGAIRNAAGRIVGFITSSGRRISPKTAASVAKKIGIEAAAVALGITAFELAEMLFDQAARPRRRRGLSYRDIRTARRVCRTISTMQTQLAACARPRSVRRLPAHGHRVVPA
ncbi:MAG: hypothetical protein HY737_06375 [Candidatus Omnitrophica bacterium]|nr:hypothetical protein [Candidatus Omnitrophota bacterium]